MFHPKIWIALVLFVFVPAASTGEGIPESAQEVLHSAGFPVYPNAAFCAGNPVQGMRLATNDSFEDVRNWYVENLPQWSLWQDEDLDLWTLYDGPDSLSSYGEIIVLNTVAITKNLNLPAWHSLDSDWTTEILVSTPRTVSEVSNQPLFVLPGVSGAEAVPEGAQVLEREILGSLEGAEDMETDRGGYYYLQDENYFEFTVAFEDEISQELANQLNIAGTTYEKVRIVGFVIVLANETVQGFDRSQELSVYPID